MSSSTERKVYVYLKENITHITPKEAIEHFRCAYVRCCKKFKCARDSLIQHEERVDDLVRILGVGWGHIPHNDVRWLLGNITRNPKGFGYYNGEWKATNSSNHGKNTKKKETEKKISEELRHHYATLAYAEVKDYIRLEKDGQCCACGLEMEEGHHCNYRRIGTPEEIKDVSPTCKVCHPFLDALYHKDWDRIIKLAKEQKSN
jgi:hypothetical protein